MHLNGRNAWIPTFHVDLCKTSLLNRLMSDFAEKRRHYENLCEAIRGTAVNIAKSLDHCIIEEIRCGLLVPNFERQLTVDLTLILSKGGCVHCMLYRMRT